jgi:tetrahydromethanopterin S-methyltransferase subunit B
VDIITNRLDQVEERISGLEDKVDELLHSDIKKKVNYDHHFLNH